MPDGASVLESWTSKVVVGLLFGVIAMAMFTPLLVILVPAVAILSAYGVYRLARGSEMAALSQGAWAPPFLWIMASPLVTVPVSGLVFALLGGTHSAEEAHLPAYSGGFSWPARYFEVAPALLAFTIPGLLNLGAFAWVFSRDGRVRSAAVVGTALGVIRTAIPATIMLLMFHQLKNPTGVTYFQYDSAFNPAPYAEVWFSGELAWLLSLLVWAVFERAISSTDLITPGRMAWVLGALAVLGVAGGSVYARSELQPGDRVLHLDGYNITESDWRVATRIWVYSSIFSSLPGCNRDMADLSSELKRAAQSPDYPAGATGSLTGEDWNTFLRRPALTAVNGQVASKRDIQKATEILNAECNNKPSESWDLMMRGEHRETPNAAAACSLFPLPFA